MKSYTFKVINEQGQKRLDKYLAEQCEDLSRSHIKKLILEGCVQVDDQPIQDPNAKLKMNQLIKVDLPEPTQGEPEPQNISLHILFEDEDLLVINKAAGMVVHPAYGNAEGTLVNALLYHCGAQLSGIRGVKMPGIVHRLDKDTSGLMVVAKSDKAHQGLSLQFTERTLYRRYLALVYGIPNPSEGDIAGNIGRHPANRQKMALVKHGGKEALTHYKIMEGFATRASLIQCRLHTGRTHQIRVHMTSLGHPLLGDPVYGKAPRWLNTEEFKTLKEYLNTHQQQALHAYQLNFRHPLTGEILSFEAPLPEYMTRLRRLLTHPELS